MRPPPSPILSSSSAAMSLNFMPLPSPHAGDDWSHRNGGGVVMDPVDLLPTDPFGMDPSSATAAIAGWIADFGDFNVDFGNQDEEDDYYSMLPSDPFGMDLSTTTAAIAGWMEDLGADIDDLEGVGGDDIFERLRCFWDNSMWLCQEYCCHGRGSYSDASRIEEDGDCVSSSSGYGSVEESESVIHPNVRGDEDEVAGQVACCDNVGMEEATMESIPRYAFLLALGYLEVQDLLRVERVSKSLRSIVKDDSHLWTSILIQWPLNAITDDSLFQLAERAQGDLQCLTLVDCRSITIDGLRRVLQNNPKLRKLSIPGCQRINIDGLVNYLKELKSLDMLAIKLLKLGGQCNVTEENYEDLKFLLGINQLQQKKHRKPQFFHIRYSFICDDDPILDIRLCPRCQKPRLVFECPAESCQQEGPDYCTGCAVCISRCHQCGRCVRDLSYMETFCLDYLCSDCFNHQDHEWSCQNVVAMS